MALPLPYLTPPATPLTMAPLMAHTPHQKRACSLGLLATILLAGSWAPAQPAQPAPPGPPPAGSQLSAYLVTIDAGQAIYERFGHNAIWVRDHAANTDEAFNYGIFDMRQSGFVLTFLQGRMLYSVEASDAPMMIEMYRRMNRSVVVEELNLTPPQRDKLYRFLISNIQPQNRFYLYNYYTDNCSTRVRDAIDRALDRQISRQLTALPSTDTYRSHTRRVSQYSFPMYTALDFVLGPFIDRPLSAWEECFLPVEMHKHLHSVTVADQDGRSLPLIGREIMRYQSTGPAPHAAPPPWFKWYLALGLGIAAILASLGALAGAKTWARHMFAACSSLWLLFVGLAGTFSAGLWLFTTHLAAHRNENLFHFNPASLALALLVPATAYRKTWARRAAVPLAILVAASSLLGLALKLLPPFTQVNAQMIALTLPTHLAVAWTVCRLPRPDPLPASSPPKSRKGKRNPLLGR